MKISFDFDSTLSRVDIQDLAFKFINKGFEVWCVTSRLSNEQSPKYKIKGIWVEHDNSDLFNVCDKIGINKGKIHFTNGKDKFEFIKENNFVFHLDDDAHEIELINKYTFTKGILLQPYNCWEKQILTYYK